MDFGLVVPYDFVSSLVLLIKTYIFYSAFIGVLSKSISSNTYLPLYKIKSPKKFFIVKVY